MNDCCSEKNSKRIHFLQHENIRPPSKHGLSNSEPIPTYYLKKFKSIYNGEELESLVLDVDYLTVIKDDIRNLRPLNKYQISFIKYNVNDDNKNDIIELFNDVLKTCIDVIMES